MDQFQSDDYLFDYRGNTNFKHKKHSIQNTQITVIEPIQKNFNIADPKQLDFEILPTTKTLLPSPMFRFQVLGKFEMKKPDVPAQGEVAAQTFDWTFIPESEINKVMVQPNWFDCLIKSVEIYSGLTRLTTYSEPKELTPFINTFINSYQDKDILNLSAPQKHHPYRWSPSFVQNSLRVDSDEWKDYAKTIFVNDEIVFDYYPRVFPFVQSVNKFDTSDESKALPIPLLGKLLIRINFVDDMQNIFKKTDSNTNKNDYRFTFTHVKLIVEEANLSFNNERKLFSSKSTLVFPGMCRIARLETFPGGTPTYRTRFSDTYMPEGLFVFAISKDVPNTQYDFSKDRSQNVFMKHNIKKIDLSFNNQSFDIKEPMPNNLTFDFFDIQTFMNHRKSPVFGIKPDFKKLTIDDFAEAGAKSCYPHFYIPLTQYFGDKMTRKVPALDDGSSPNKMSALDLFLTFDTGGSTAEASYGFVMFWTDYCMAFDAKNKKFFSPHNIAQS